VELDPLLPHVFPLDLFVAEALKRAAQAALVYLEAVHLDGVLGADALLGEEGGGIRPLVALQLDHFPKLLVLDDGAIASKLLLESLDDLLQVDLGVDTLHSGQTLAAVTLLNTDVNNVLWCARWREKEERRHQVQLREKRIRGEKKRCSRAEQRVRGQLESALMKNVGRLSSCRCSPPIRIHSEQDWKIPGVAPGGRGQAPFALRSLSRSLDSPASSFSASAKGSKEPPKFWMFPISAIKQVCCCVSVW